MAESFNGLPSSQLDIVKLSQDENLPSSLQTSEKNPTGKPRKKPTVTPRTFTRFFTPRSSLSRGGKIGASRQALRDITASASNRSAQARRRTPTKDTINVLADEDLGLYHVGKRRKIGEPSPETTPDRSSPLKRIRGQSLNLLDDSNTDIQTDDEEYQLYTGRRASRRDVKKFPQPIVRNSRHQGPLGRISDREIGKGRWRLPQTIPNEWQCETANFYTVPTDLHVCNRLGDLSEQTVPFCVTSCNTNSLVAVGDEEGGIRLLESARGGKPEFSKAYLTFRPHTNAILDLAFSPNDLLLATASGDQSSQIIDMPTQRAIKTLTGHVSSVKQVLFQPGSSSVLATSSRDGSVCIWDLRCKGSTTPTRELKVSLEGGSSEDQITQSTPNDLSPRLTYSRAIDTISAAHTTRYPHRLPNLSNTSTTNDIPSKSELPAQRSRRGDVSITSLSFLSPGRQHLLLTACEADATVKLWDLRNTHSPRRCRDSVPIPVSSTRQPEAHTRHRHFGVTSMALSTDAGRLYTLCRDNVVYAYSTPHLILGSAPELSSSFQPASGRKSRRKEKEGLGPLYGFRHRSFHATTFYVKIAVRQARDSHTELLAAGSSDGCVVLWPTDERYMGPPSSSSLSSQYDSRQRLSSGQLQKGEAEEWPLTPPSSQGWQEDGWGARRASRFSKTKETTPIFTNGIALVRGHTREVTGVAWAFGGELISVGDDFQARCWREDGDWDGAEDEDGETASINRTKGDGFGRRGRGLRGEEVGARARDLRKGGESEGRRWGCGWAEIEGEEWDKEEG
ncbi:MAG: hypothetical protein Q9190_006212 [Brigantiaea leucoxantha]